MALPLGAPRKPGSQSRHSWLRGYLLLLVDYDARIWRIFDAAAALLFAADAVVVDAAAAAAAKGRMIGSSLGQRNGNKKFTGPERPPMQKTFVIPFRGLGC